MDNSNSYHFPHTCAHLWHLWNKEHLTGKQILARTLEMQMWLDANCIVNGKRTFIWSIEYTKFPQDYNVQYSGFKGVNTISLANCIYFKHEQDLLAFRLRWGIQA